MLKSSGTKFGAFSDNPQPSHNGKTTTGSNSLSSKENTGSSKVTKVEPNDFVTKRFGLKYDPPTISKDKHKQIINILM